MEGENLSKKGKEKKGERKSQRESSNKRNCQTNPKIFDHLFKKKITTQEKKSDGRGRKNTAEKVYFSGKCQKRYGEAAKNCRQHRIERITRRMSNAKNFSYSYKFITISKTGDEIWQKTKVSKKGYKENSKSSKKKNSLLKSIFKHKT